MDQSLKDQLRRQAYELWEKDGRPTGKELAYWVAAERQHEAQVLEGDLEEGLEETFPASDTPSALLRGEHGSARRTASFEDPHLLSTNTSMTGIRRALRAEGFKQHDVEDYLAGGTIRKQLTALCRAEKDNQFSAPGSLTDCSISR